MKDFDVNALGGAKIPEGVRFTKELKRNVNGKEASIFIGRDAQNKKVRYTLVDGKMEELQERTTAGKNTYVTKKESDAIIMQMLGTKSVPADVSVKFVTDHNGTVTPTLLFKGEKLDAQGMKLLAQKQRVADMQNEELAKADQPKEMPGHVKVVVDITQKLVADGVIETDEARHIREQKEKEAEKDLADAPKPKTQGATSEPAEKRPITRKPSKMVGNRAKTETKNIVLPDTFVLGKRRKPEIKKQVTAPEGAANTQRKDKAKTDGANIARAFNNTNRQDAYEPSVRAIKQLGKDNVIDFLRSYQANAKAEARNIITTLSHRGSVYKLDNDAKAAALQLLKSVAQTPQGKGKGFEKIIADIEKNGLKYPFTQNADMALRKLDLSEPKPQGATTKPAPKPKTAAEIENEKKYNSAVNNGKSLAEKITKGDGSTLAAATKNIEARYLKGFLKGFGSSRGVGTSRSSIMSTVQFSNAPESAKKEFALKVLEAASQHKSIKGFSYNSQTIESLMQDVRQNGLTKENAVIIGQFLVRL